MDIGHGDEAGGVRQGIAGVVDALQRALVRQDLIDHDRADPFRLGAQDRLQPAVRLPLTGIRRPGIGDIGGNYLHVLALGSHPGDGNINGAEYIADCHGVPSFRRLFPDRYGVLNLRELLAEEPDKGRLA